MFLIRILLVLATFASFGVPAFAQTPAIAFAARIVGDQTRARLIVDFDRKIKHEAYLLDNPRRIIIDLPRVYFGLEGESGRLPKTLVSDMRYGTISQKSSRIVLQLNHTVVIEDSRLSSVEEGRRHRLILDLVKADQEAFSKAVRAETRDKPAKPKNTDAKAQRKYRVVLDPGHGGIDGGAIGGLNTVEKQITLDFARGLKKILSKDAYLEVLLTREDDEFVSLSDRIKFAREKEGDLFISIHADSLRQRNIRGATVYTLSQEGSDEISNALAKKQNRVDLIAGLHLPEVKQAEVTDILIDLTRRETKAFSENFAKLMVVSMKNDVRLIRNPHRAADFFVLKAPEIPSVLLELGYLSNEGDEKQMSSKQWQTKAANAVARAVRGFFAPRLVAR